jgi:hypothetical protein
VALAFTLGTMLHEVPLKRWVMVRQAARLLS